MKTPSSPLVQNPVSELLIRLLAPLLCPSSLPKTWSLKTPHQLTPTLKKTPLHFHWDSSNLALSNWYKDEILECEHISAHLATNTKILLGLNFSKPHNRVHKSEQIVIKAGKRSTSWDYIKNVIMHPLCNSCGMMIWEINSEKTPL